ncbi:hypothetical protein V1506DRAFT_532320 [Lipomyces tetrasporus]
MCKLYTATMKEGMTLEKHFHYMMHLRDQLKMAKVDIDPAMFMEVFARSLTPFYNDALPSLVTEKDMIDKMFSVLTHFRLKRQTLTTGSVNSAYAVSGSSSSKPNVRITRPGQKKFEPNWHKKKDQRISTTPSLLFTSKRQKYLLHREPTKFIESHRPRKSISESDIEHVFLKRYCQCTGKT